MNSRIDQNEKDVEALQEEIENLKCSMEDLEQQTKRLKVRCDMLTTAALMGGLGLISVALSVVYVSLI